MHMRDGRRCFGDHLELQLRNPALLHRKLLPMAAGSRRALKVPWPCARRQGWNLFVVRVGRNEGHKRRSETLGFSLRAHNDPHLKGKKLHVTSHFLGNWTVLIGDAKWFQKSWFHAGRQTVHVLQTQARCLPSASHASWLTVSVRQVSVRCCWRDQTLWNRCHKCTSTETLGCLQKTLWSNTDFVSK